MTGPYDDILHLPHPVSRKHPRMAVADRAAQFSPFAALTGYDDAVREAARLTDRRLELDEYEQQALNDRLQQILSRLPEQPVVRITYFRPDSCKEGGAYVTVNGVIKRLDTVEREIRLVDDTRIPIEDIWDIDEPPQEDEDFVWL